MGFHQKTLACAALLPVWILSGCGGGSSKSSAPPPQQPGGVVFTAASTQSWLKQFGPPIQAPSAYTPTSVLTGVQTDPSGDLVISGYSLGSFSNPSQGGGPAENLLAKYDASGNQVWLNEFGTMQGDFLNSVSVASTGEVVAGGETLGAYPGFSNPDHLWMNAYGQNVFNAVNQIAVDSQDNLFAVGSTMGSFPGSSGQATSSYVLKINSSGTLLWSPTVLFPNVIGDVAALAVDSQGDVVVAGAALNPGQVPKPALFVGFGAAPDECGFLAKFSGQTGTTIWTDAFSSGLGDQLSSVTIDSNNNVIASGITNGIFSSSFQQPDDNILLVKFTPDGNNEWVQQLGTGPLTNGTIPVGPLVTSGASNNIYLGAGTQGAYPGFSNPTSAIEMLVSKFGP